MDYVAKSSKSYATQAEFDARMALYSAMDARIAEHNASGASFQLGHNFLSDMTEGEKSQFVGGHYLIPERSFETREVDADEVTTDLP